VELDRGEEEEAEGVFPVASVVLPGIEGELGSGVVGVKGTPSKSQDTPCFEQFPHTGCTSSHCLLVSWAMTAGYQNAMPLFFLVCIFGNPL
jgi:hypothetical protein